MSGERENYLEPQEQLLIAAKVNRVCELQSDEFDPSTHVQDAQDVVNALNSRVLASGRFKGSASYTRPSKSELRAGATSAGQVNASFDETKRSEVRFGVREYRIGFYVATKYNDKRQSSLIFEHFWDRGEVNEAFEDDQPQTEIVYKNDSLEVVAINKRMPTIKTLFPVIIRITATVYNRVPLWQKADSNAKN